MNRYFLEVSYKGTNYAGFQIQENAVTIQSELEKAMEVFFRRKMTLTGSSRTDTGVHAEQNFFHFDSELSIEQNSIYNLNSILPEDIAVLHIEEVQPEAHCRFDAISREYAYTVYRHKNPFLQGLAYYYPYTLNITKLQEAAGAILGAHDFKSFSKRNTQVRTFTCKIEVSKWVSVGDRMIYSVKANRFLRGMIRGLVGTMLQVGRNKITVNEFKEIFEHRDSSLADFSVPGTGLCLKRIEFPETCFKSGNKFSDENSLRL